MYKKQKDFIYLTLFFIFNIAIAQAMRLNETVSTVHCYVVLLVGLISAFRGNLAGVMYVCAYITGCEVLWRMTKADIFWESGKYAVMFLMASKFLITGVKKPLLPLLYCLLLIPSTFTASITFDTTQELRKQLSFNLSGPYALAMSVLFFQKIYITKEQLYKLFLMMMAPIAGIASLAIFSTYTTAHIGFRTGSNFVTSGGYGPNQVSAMLGLAALLTFFYLVDNKKAPAKPLLFVVLPLRGLSAAKARSE